MINKRVKSPEETKIFQTATPTDTKPIVDRAVLLDSVNSSASTNLIHASTVITKAATDRTIATSVFIGRLQY